MRHITVADLPDVHADVEGLRALARNYGDSVRRAHDAAGMIANVWNKLDEHVQAPFSSSLDQVVLPLTRAADRFRSAADSFGGAVNRFAGEVEVMLALRGRLREPRRT